MRDHLFGIGLCIVLASLAGATGCSFGSKGVDGGDGGVDGGDGGVDGGDGGVDGGDGGACVSGLVGEHRSLCPQTLLGEGGFFGVSGIGLMDVWPSGAFAIGAHYADLNDGQEPAYQAGRVYLFLAGAFPVSLDQAVLRLEPTDSAELGGFGYAIGNACDLNADGILDLPIGNHLYSPPNTQLYAAGRGAVFWGEAASLSPDRVSYHHLSDDLISRSDAIGQTVVCTDADGDGQADLLLGGQNAGPADTGLVAVFKGGQAGLGETQDWVLAPPLAEARQYFGASGLVADLDGDGSDDLAIGGWGLARHQRAGGAHTGGVLVYRGGADWSAGPSFGLYPGSDDPAQAGVELTLAGGPVRFLAVGAPDLGAAGPDDPAAPGGVLLYRIGSTDISDGLVAQTLSAPAGYEGVGFGQALAWVPDYDGPGQGALLVGMKYADAAVDNTGTGAVAVFRLAAGGQAFDAQPAILLAPAPAPNDAFGGAIVPLGDVDGDGLSDFFVGMESHVEGSLVDGVQTGGVIFFH